MGDGVDDLERAARAWRVTLPRVEGVRGNGDSDPDLWLRRLIGRADRPILLLHGHIEGVNDGLGRIIGAAKASAASLVLFGHTHRAFFGKHHGVLAINPGSISRPRGRDNPTFAVIDAPDEAELACELQFYEVGAQTGRIREIELG